jgi:hypothetical protein
MPEYIEAIIAQLKMAQTREEMYAILDGYVKKEPDFHCVDDTSFHGGLYRFQCTLKLYTDRMDTTQILADCAHIESIEYIHIGASDMCVIVTKLIGDCSEIGS